MNRQSIMDRLDALNEDLDRVMLNLEDFLVDNGVTDESINTISRLVDRTYDEIAGGLVDAGHAVVRDPLIEEEKEEQEVDEINIALRGERYVADEDTEHESIPDDPSESDEYSVHASVSEVEEDFDDDATIELPPRHLRLSISSDDTVDIYTWTSNTIRQLEWLRGVNNIANGYQSDSEYDYDADSESGATIVVTEWEEPFLTPA